VDFDVAVNEGKVAGVVVVFGGNIDPNGCNWRRRHFKGKRAVIDAVGMLFEEEEKSRG
jgi:hypothetical protein